MGTRSKSKAAAGLLSALLLLALAVGLLAGLRPLYARAQEQKAPEPDEEYIVHLCGDTVILSNGLLVQALSRLPAQKQEMLYLSFFKRMPQHEIGRRYGRSRSAAGYHIRKAIQQLYEEMEGLAHEE